MFKIITSGYLYFQIPTLKIKYLDKSDVALQTYFPLNPLVVLLLLLQAGCPFQTLTSFQKRHRAIPPIR